MNQVEGSYVEKGEGPKGHHHFRFNSVGVYKYTPTIVFPVPNSVVPANHKLREQPWQFASTKVIKTVFT